MVLGINNLFNCIICRSHLIKKNEEAYTCSICYKSFPLRDGILYTIDSVVQSFDERHADNFFAQLKNFFKRWPKIYYFFVHFFGGIQMNTNAETFVSRLKKDSVIVNIGSGPQIIRENVWNVDIALYPGVKIIASAESLPFFDHSVDAVICDNLLEHVKNPATILKEIERVLKKDGLVYVATPFMIGFHSSPNDYYRWTHEGLRELLSSAFIEQELNLQYGPTAAAMYMMYNWFALLLSFNVQLIYEFWLIIFMILLAPVKLLDLVVGKFSFAKGIALGFYYIGRKR